MNKEQALIIKSNEKYIYIDAGAGTGKTYTLINKIKYILDNKLAFPSEIVAITFTNKAATELQERLNNSEVIVKTFHKYIFDLINKDNHFTLFDETTQKEFSQNDLLKITKYKNKQTIFKPLRYYQYNQYLLTNKLIDFDDIFLIYLNKFKGQENIKYLLIDEFQDTNNLQYLIIKKIINPETKIICVGDINQSVYSFRGANKKIVNKYIKEFKSKIYSLSTNYRSNKGIINFINHFNNKSKLIANNNQNGVIKAKRFNSINEENEFIYNLLINIKHKYYLNKILITARNEKRLYYIKNYLASKLFNYMDLNIMTLHSTKGLEFEVVIMLGLEENEFPMNEENSLNNYRDEKRLFYVGISRAKSHLFLLSTKVINNLYLKSSVFFKLAGLHIS